MEIFLLAAGGIIFVLSFLLPSGERKQGAQAAADARAEVKDLVGREMESVKSHVDDVVDEAVTYAMEKTERSLERLSNEKIMAINEYSDTVLAEIQRNHEEAVFLYDMLNNKHTNLKNTVSEVNRTVKVAEETVSSFQRLVPETETAGVGEASPAPQGTAAMPGPAETPKPVELSGLARLSRHTAAKAGETPKAAFVRVAEEEMAKAAREAGGAEEAPVRQPQAEDAEAGNSNDRILALYSRGADPVQIAKELGLGVGEVKLVIGLFDSQTGGKL